MDIHVLDLDLYYFFRSSNSDIYIIVLSLLKVAFVTVWQEWISLGHSSCFWFSIIIIHWGWTFYGFEPLSYFTYASGIIISICVNQRPNSRIPEYQCSRLKKAHILSNHRALWFLPNPQQIFVVLYSKFDKG